MLKGRRGRGKAVPERAQRKPTFGTASADNEQRLNFQFSDHKAKRSTPTPPQALEAWGYARPQGQEQGGGHCKDRASLPPHSIRGAPASLCHLKAGSVTK